MKAIRALIAGAATAVLFTAAPASAAVERFTEDWTGETFTCAGHTYTLKGDVKAVVHETFDAEGREHFALTLTMSGVTATDETGGTYRFTGAESYHFQETMSGSVGHFTIHHLFVAQGQGVVDADRVVVHHLSPNDPTERVNSTCFEVP